MKITSTYLFVRLLTPRRSTELTLASVSFVAIIPLENIAEYAGEQLALYCGEVSNVYIATQLD